MTVTDFPALADVEGRMKLLQGKMGEVFAEAGENIDLTKVKCLGTGRTTFDVAAQIRAWNDELTDLGKKHADLTEVKKAAERAKVAQTGEPGDGTRTNAPVPQTDDGAPVKSFGAHFVESKAYKDVRGQNGPEVTLNIDLKTLMTTSAGFPPQTTRTGRLVDYATTPLQVAQILPQTTTSQSSVVYMEETTFTNNAAETAEGNSYPEAALAFTEQSSPVRKISTFLPVTDEQMEDEPQVRGIIDNRLPFMIRQRLDSQILAGNGTAPNISGILDWSTIQTQAKGADPIPDAVYKAMVLVETVGQAMPNAIIMNPTNWQTVRLLRTADGIYIWGNPSDAGPERMWGVQVLRAQALTAGTAIVGDFANFIELAVRRGISVQVSNSHSTYFVDGKQAIRADMRVALVGYRPTAFCQVTGL